MTREQQAADAVRGFALWAGPQPWHAWATLTYAPTSPRTGEPFNPTVRSARRAVDWFLGTGRVRTAVWVTERGERFGRVHNHALIQLFEDGAAQPDREFLDRLWRRVFGIAEIEAYDPVRGAAGYCGKYLRKQDCDWDIWHSSNDSPTQRSQLRNDWLRTTDCTLMSRPGTRLPTLPYGISKGRARRRSQAGDGPAPTSKAYYNGTRRATPESSTNPPGNHGIFRILIRDMPGRLT